MTRVAIYDLDQTIARRPTFARWLAYWTVRHAPWRLPLLGLQGLATLAYVARLVDRRRLKALGIGFVMGRAGRRAVSVAARGFAARELRTNIMPQALASIAAERAAGARLVLATASMDFYAGALAAACGIEGVIATRAQWEDDRLLPGTGPNCYGERKRARVETWLAEAGLAREGVRIAFYSDHISDLPALEWADEAVVVNPAPAFGRIARALGWRIERWN